MQGGRVLSAAELGRFAPRGVTKYVEMGATPGQAARFAQHYRGLGHHAFIPRNATWAKVPGVKKVADVLGVTAQKLQGRVPAWMVESPFNVVKPDVETGQFYRRHVGIDKDYNGGKVGRAFGGTPWSGEDLGWEKYGPLKQFWYGTPGPTKAVGLGGPAALDGLGRSTNVAQKRRR